MKPSVTNSDERLLAPKDAAALLPATTHHTLLRWARNGQVPVVELPSGRKFFRREDIEALLEPLPVTPAHGIPINEEDEDVALFERTA